MNLSFSEILGGVGLLLNAGALVWGAATLTASVKNLTTIVGELKTVIETIMSDVSDLKIRLGIVEDRQER